jgi:D-arabinose 5-phosphate isomerase GutQ/sugar/nucleoside kinase (ribokinase family)
MARLAAFVCAGAQRCVARVIQHIHPGLRARGRPCRGIQQGRCASTTRNLVLGSGSNVMDLFFPVRKLPQPGDKQYYAAETCVTDAVVGGVTLNHLSWARILGAPTGLMALQGTDANGETIRAKMGELGVSTEFVRVSGEYATSVSHILLDAGSGERTILMAPASTSRLSGAKMAAEFTAAMGGRACMLTTEVSQVPLSGVLALLNMAAAAGIPSLLDVDVTPSVATGPAQLGSLEELRACVTKATVLKLTRSAAAELLSLVSAAPLDGRLEGVAQQLVDAFGVRMCVVTDGSRGSALALGRAHAPSVVAVTVPIYAGVTQRDATGAGDAFFGGVIASLHAWGFPSTQDGLVRIGRVAAASGAACVEVIGALPVPGSGARMAALCPEVAPLLKAAAALDASKAGPAPAAPAGSSAAFLGSLALDSVSLAAVAASYGAAERASLTAIVAALRRSASSSPNGPHVFTTGIGKAGAVASRFATSLRSLGVRASYIHGAEWVHGDYGGAGRGDCAIAFSHSGTTAELLAAAAMLTSKGVSFFSITSSGASPLAAASVGHCPAPAAGELLGGVPTRSVVSQEAVANALLSALVEAAGITRETFLAHHPGGKLGAATALGIEGRTSSPDAR